MENEKLQTIRHSCAHVMAEAILSAIRNTESAYGFPAYKDLSFV